MLIFLDTETTGVETTDFICSIAILTEDSYIYELVNEGKKIPAQASAIHHITNEMIQKSPKLKETQAWEYLQTHNSKENTLIGHNIAFDMHFLEQMGFVWQGDVIDTLRTSKHLLEDCEQFSLQFLRYELKLYRDEEHHKEHYGIKDALSAHSALSDALVLKLLFETLCEMASIDELRLLTHKKVLLLKLPFGKYQSRYIEEIAMSDRAYLEWMLGLEDLDEDLRYSLEYYLQG